MFNLNFNLFLHNIEGVHFSNPYFTVLKKKKSWRENWRNNGAIDAPNSQVTQVALANCRELHFVLSLFLICWTMSIISIEGVLFHISISR